mmetsp:Transcript_18290/g.45515  ORF Transcript_18290/g.45515 Transcript_18290/m.45515 type:complete len:205 (+) Transcript_18290:699-1313(+)
MGHAKVRYDSRSRCVSTALTSSSAAPPEAPAAAPAAASGGQTRARLCGGETTAPASASSPTPTAEAVVAAIAAASAAASASKASAHSLSCRMSLTTPCTHSATAPPADRASNTVASSSSPKRSPSTAARMNAEEMGSGRMCPSSNALPTRRPMNTKRRRAAADSGDPGGSGCGNNPPVCHRCSDPSGPSSSGIHVRTAVFSARS